MIDSSIFLWIFFWFDLNLYQYLMVWLEIGCVAHTCPRDLKLGTHIGGSIQKNFGEFFLWFNLNFYLYLRVWLENGHLHISPNTCVWLELETWNLEDTLGWSIQAFANRIFWFDLNFYLYLMVWLENGHLHISANTCARALKLGTHLGWINSRIFVEIIFLVWLELVPVHNGLTWNWTFAYMSQYLC